MEFNEAKKLLYKNKPKAKFIQATKEALLYSATFDTGTSDEFGAKQASITFVIPLSDIGDAKFMADMDAQLLIRYIESFSH